MQCPFCSESMTARGRVELLGEAGLAALMLVKTAWRNIIRADVYFCPGCSYLALFAVDHEPANTPQEEMISPDIRTCSACGACNFRRDACHGCGRDLPDDPV